MIKSWIFSIITPVFSVTWSFRNHFNIQYTHFNINLINKLTILHTTNCQTHLTNKYTLVHILLCIIFLSIHQFTFTNLHVCSIKQGLIFTLADGLLKMQFIVFQQVVLQKWQKYSFPGNGSTQSSTTPEFETCSAHVYSMKSQPFDV